MSGHALPPLGATDPRPIATCYSGYMGAGGDRDG